MAHTSNLSPFSVEVPAAAYNAFAQADEDMVAAQHSTQAFLDTFAGLGGSLAYMSRPNAASSPEHRHIYALWTRLCLGKAARMLDVDVSEFESVYSGAVKAGDTVEIGRREIRGPSGDVVGYTSGEVKTVTDWKGYVSNAGRVVKQAMQRLVADKLAESKAELAYAEKACADAKAKSSVSVAALNAAQAVSAKAEAEAAKAEAEADAAPRGAKAAAKAKAAKLRVKADSLVAETAALVDAVDDDAEVELAAMAEVKAEAARVAALQAQLPTQGRGAGTAKTDAEKWAARVDALLKDVRAVTSPTGEVDAVALVEALIDARKAIVVAVVTE
jgi:hypothetical protein